MSLRLTYRPRDGVLFGVVAGKMVRLATTRTQAADISMWSWHEAAQTGQMPGPSGGPAGPAGRKLKVIENAPLEIYDYPGEYAQRFDGVDKGGSKAGGSPNHRPRGRAVFVKAPGGGFYLHGPPSCGDRQCIVIAGGWDSLFDALKEAKQASIVIEV